MQPIRGRIHTNGSTYTLDTLANQYQSVRPVRTEKKQIEVTDEEVCVFLDHANEWWPVIFWLGAGIITVLMMCGIVSN